MIIIYIHTEQETCRQSLNVSVCEFLADGDSNTDENSINKDIADEHNIADEDRIADVRSTDDRIAGDRIADDRIADDRIADEKIVDEENSMAKQYKFPLRNRK